MHLSTTELIIILVIVVLIFGIGRIGKLGQDLGSGIRNFRNELRSNEDKDTKDEPVDPETK